MIAHDVAGVTVVAICESRAQGAPQEHIDDVVRYLERHRISCGLRVILHQEGSPAAQLIRVAQDERRSARRRCLGAQPVRRVDVRRHDGGFPRDKPVLLPDVVLMIGPQTDSEMMMQTPLEVDFQGLSRTPQIRKPLPGMWPSSNSVTAG